MENVPSKTCAFFGDARLKKSVLERIRQHREQDDLIRGSYGYGDALTWKGCAIACLSHDNRFPHLRFEQQTDIPLQLGQVIDACFEHMSPAGYQRLPERFIKAVPVGADLQRVWPQLAVWLLDEYGPVDEPVNQPANLATLVESALLSTEPTPAEIQATSAAFMHQLRAYAAGESKTPPKKIAGITYTYALLADSLYGMEMYTMSILCNILGKRLPKYEGNLLATTEERRLFQMRFYDSVASKLLFLLSTAPAPPPSSSPTFHAPTDFPPY